MGYNKSDKSNFSLISYKNITFGNSSGVYNIQNLHTALERMEINHADMDVRITWTSHHCQQVFLSYVDALRINLLNM